MLLLSLALEQQNVSVSKSTSKAPPPSSPFSPGVIPWAELGVWGSRHICRPVPALYGSPRRILPSRKCLCTYFRQGGPYLSQVCPRFVPGLFLVYATCVGRRFVHSLSQVCPYFVPFLSLVCHRLVSGLSLVSLWFVPGLSQFVPGLSHVCPWFVPNKWGKNKYILVLVNSNKLYKHCYLEVLLQVSGWYTSHQSNTSDTKLKNSLLTSNWTRPRWKLNTWPTYRPAVMFTDGIMHLPCCQADSQTDTQTDR